MAEEGELSSWEVTIPGAPPSVNHMYAIGRGRRPVRKAEGVESYQLVASHMVRLATPGSWKRALSSKRVGYIRIRYWFYLRRDIDCDNALKALNDAVAVALGVNDRSFLPCVMAKAVGPEEEPRVVLELSLA